MRRTQRKLTPIAALIALQIATTPFILEYYSSPTIIEANRFLADFFGGDEHGTSTAADESLEHGGHTESFADVRQGQIQNAIASLGLGRNEILNLRNVSNTLGALESEVGDIFKDGRSSSSLALRSCFENIEATSGSGSVIWSARCHPQPVGDGETLVVVNPLETKRALCGTNVPGLGTTRLDPRECDREYWERMMLPPPPSIFDPDEDRTINVLHSKAKSAQTKQMRDVECDVPCRHPKAGFGIVNEKRIDGTNWVITHSMEGCHYYAQVCVDPKAHLRDRYYSTYSFKSEVPLPYFSWAEYGNILAKPIDYDKAIKGASFLARNCGSHSKREELVTNLQKYLRVDSLSSCMNNAKPPPGSNINDKVSVMKHYLFHFAFENGLEEDYVTEKMWGPHEAGTVAVYLGAPNVKDLAPPGSVISVVDFPSYKELGEYLVKVAENKTLWEQHHEWKTRGLPESFLKRYNLTHTHSECRTCRWAYAKKYGMAWDHYNQRIVRHALPPSICFDDKTQLSAYPYKEVWSSMASTIEQGTSQKQCSKGGMHKISTFSVGPYTVHRSFSEHDNVIDVTIRVENTGGKHNAPLSFSVSTPVRNKGRYFNAPKYDDPKLKDSSFFLVDRAQPRLNATKIISIQDGSTRLTVLTDWATRMSSLEDGVISILVHDGATLPGKGDMLVRRIRLIPEDQDELHYNETRATLSYFCTVASKEFYTPLEFFSVVNQLKKT